MEKQNLDKHILEYVILSSTDEIRRSFIAGLIDSDGYVADEIISISSSNKSTIYKIRKLLAIDGISTYIDTNENHIYINNQVLFYKLYNKYLKIKTTFNKLLSGKTYGFIPKTIC